MSMPKLMTFISKVLSSLETLKNEQYTFALPQSEAIEFIIILLKVLISAVFQVDFKYFLIKS